MAKITTCDRCDAKSKDEYGMSRLYFSNEGTPTFTYDLCPECINELSYIVKEWVENEILQK